MYHKELHSGCLWKQLCIQLKHWPGVSKVSFSASASVSQLPYLQDESLSDAFVIFPPYDCVLEAASSVFTYPRIIIFSFLQLYFLKKFTNSVTDMLKTKLIYISLSSDTGEINTAADRILCLFSSFTADELEDMNTEFKSPVTNV